MFALLPVQRNEALSASQLVSTYPAIPTCLLQHMKHLLANIAMLIAGELKEVVRK